MTLRDGAIEEKFLRTRVTELVSQALENQLYSKRLFRFAAEIATSQEGGQEPLKDVVSDQQRGPAHPRL
jgi:hypothetical protein